MPWFGKKCCKDMIPLDLVLTEMRVDHTVVVVSVVTLDVLQKDNTKKRRSQMISKKVKEEEDDPMKNEEEETAKH